MKALLLLAVLCLAVIGTGVEVAKTGYEVRMLNASIEELRQNYDAALNEQTQLQLERSAVASYALTETTAQQQLSMIYPVMMVEVPAAPENASLPSAAVVAPSSEALAALREARP